MLPLNETSAIGQPDERLYLQNIIATVLDITVVSWSAVLACGEVSSSTDERDLAGHLYREMYLEKRRRFGPKRPPRFEEEVGTRSSISLPRSDGRIDFKVIYSFDEDEYFGIESKRLCSVDNELVRKYVNEGVMRFVDGKYSLDHNWAAMLGFVIDGNISNCTDRVYAQLTKTKGKNRLKSNWANEASFGPYKDLYRTRHHQRGKCTLMTILHLFLTIPTSTTPLAINNISVELNSPDN
jgi:hypothetical protein